MTILITGGAGFIGYHVAKHILGHSSYDVVIIDNLNDYYSTSLKKSRLMDLETDVRQSMRGPMSERLSYFHADIADLGTLESIFARYKFDAVIHLAAQAGVRYAKTNPEAYISSNILGFFNVLECVKRHHVDLMLYASSSSVYGNPPGDTAFKETLSCESPLSLYAATKLSDELLAKVYSRMSQTRFVGMRFFNVYGPWGRPDMAYFAWATALRNGDPITVHGKGKMLRDMTYIDDVVAAIVRFIGIDKDSQGKWLREVTEGTPYPNHTLFNIGNSQPVVMQHVLDFLSANIARPRSVIYKAKGREEAYMTRADTSKLKDIIGFSPDTSADAGLAQFLSWFRGYHDGDCSLGTDNVLLSHIDSATKSSGD